MHYNLYMYEKKFAIIRNVMVQIKACPGGKCYV